MPIESRRAGARAAASVRPSPASRFAAAARRKGAPPRRPDATGPGFKASSTVGAIRNAAAAPTAPATGAAAVNGKTRDFARPAAGAGRKTTALSVSHVARQDAHSTAAAMPRARPPAAACAALSPPSEACHGAADASRWRRSASLPNGRAPSARGDMPPGAPRASVWIARRLPVAPRAVRAAHIVPTPARPSVTWWRSGHRRSP